MPNWCYQNLRIKGPKDQLTKFKADMLAVAAKDPNWKPDDTPFTFELFAKFPKILSFVSGWLEDKENKLIKQHRDFVMAECGTLSRSKVQAILHEKYGFTDWYSWCLFNWGTKWDCTCVSLNLESPDRRDYTFETALTPAIPAIRKASSKYPKLTFRLTYTEESNAFAGLIEFKNGAVTDEYDVPYAILYSSLNQNTLPYFLAMATVPVEAIARKIGSFSTVDADGSYITSDFLEKIGQAVLRGDLDIGSKEFLDQTIKLFGQHFDKKAGEVMNRLFTSRQELEDAIVNIGDDILETIRQEILTAT